MVQIIENSCHKINCGNAGMKICQVKDGKSDTKNQESEKMA
jgi:hypothetical protein